MSNRGPVRDGWAHQTSVTRETRPGNVFLLHDLHHFSFPPGDRLPYYSFWYIRRGTLEPFSTTCTTKTVEDLILNPPELRVEIQRSNLTSLLSVSFDSHPKDRRKFVLLNSYGRSDTRLMSSIPRRVS